MRRFDPYGGYYYLASPEYAIPPPAPAPAPPGYLRLQIEPPTAEVYVDGYYMGTAAEFNATTSGRALEPGAHRVEIRAEGFETLTLDVRISPDLSISYRRTLTRVPSAPPPSSPPAVRETTAGGSTMYVIPGCYAGNRPPRADMLPAGCSVARVRTLPD